MLPLRVEQRAWCGLLFSFSWCACPLVLLRRLAACHKMGHFIIEFQVKQEVEPWRRTISFWKDARGCRENPPLIGIFYLSVIFYNFTTQFFLNWHLSFPPKRKLRLRTTDSMSTTTTDPSPSLPSTSFGLKFQETEELGEG